MIYPQITDNSLRMALGVPPDDAVEKKVLSTIRALQEHFPNTSLKVPEVRYDLKGHTAGIAHARIQTINGERVITEQYIRINNELLYTDHYTDMIQNTVPHEVAHCVVKQIWPLASHHGQEWQYVMRLLNLAPERCHSYETTAARKRTKMPRPYIYVCVCSDHSLREHAMTKIIHRRIQQQGKGYNCTECGTSLRFSHTTFDS